MSMISISVLILLAFSGESWAQLDPVRNFCRRFGHQTAVIGRKLYIDGGFVNYNPLSQNPTNYSNTQLLFLDLDDPSANDMPQLYANLTKNATIPNVNGGTLWADDVNKRFYLFGGDYQQQGPPPAQFTLWSYDTLNESWESFGQPTQTLLNGVAYGAGVSVSERGEGYYYGGWMSSETVAGWTGPDVVATSSLIRYDMDGNSWTNNTGPDDGIRRAEGAMVFLPIGDGGMLVYFGGVQQDDNGTVEGQPMEQIILYDVQNGKWYSQNATGTVPQMRRKFCAGATWAEDQSSYNIYLYGGASMPPDTAGFDDVYILTIPTFQWIKLYPDDGDNTKTGEYPHHSLSCNVISGAQMLIIGGTFPLSDDCDAPDQFGQHNLDLGLQNSDGSPWFTFEPNLTRYVVPEPIRKVVGGTVEGGATKTEPAEQAYGHPDLKVLLKRKARIPERTPTRVIPGPTDGAGGSAGDDDTALSTGAVAGIAVGGIAAVAALLVGCFWLIKRHRRNTLPPGAELDGANGTGGGGGGVSGMGGSQHLSWNHASSPHPSASSAYTPSSPPPVSPFLMRSPSGGVYSAVAHPRPAELEAPPPGTTNFWNAAEGVYYELVMSPAPRASMPLQQLSPVPGRTKIDSEGRVWVQVMTPAPEVAGSPPPAQQVSAVHQSPQELGAEIGTGATATYVGGDAGDRGTDGLGGGRRYHQDSRGAGTGPATSPTTDRTPDSPGRHLTYYHP